MKYRLTCLTPVIVGDGYRLSPIDYMVWKDQINILDQHRIFRLLAKGPRLEGYLTQLKKAQKLEFASWGGFAQNFADRRVPFEDPSLTRIWERAATESLHIPTFAASTGGPYLPGSAIKGALRSGLFFSQLKDAAVDSLSQRMQAERPPRHPGAALEDETLGNGGGSRMRALAASDSAPIDRAAFQIHLLRVATLVQARNQQGYSLGWKLSGRGSVDGAKVDESTPWFAEMARPGTVFEGTWLEREYRKGRGAAGRGRVFEAANQYASRMLAAHHEYAATTGMGKLGAGIEELQTRLSGLSTDSACMLCIGWGGGFLSKTPWLGREQGSMSGILRALPYYSRAMQSGMPFPKTRRVVFEKNQPASLPGWALLEIVA